MHGMATSQHAQHKLHPSRMLAIESTLEDTAVEAQSFDPSSIVNTSRTAPEVGVAFSSPQTGMAVSPEVADECIRQILCVTLNPEHMFDEAETPGLPIVYLASLHQVCEL